HLAHVGALLPHDLVVDLAESLDTHEKIAQTRAPQFARLRPARQRLGIRDDGRGQAALRAVGDGVTDVRIERWLATLDVDGVIAVDVDEGPTDGLRLLEAHEGVLGMLLVLDAVEEIAEVAAEVAGLPEPEDSPAGDLARRADRVDGLGRRRE